jgi:hypothetical protein
MPSIINATTTAGVSVQGDNSGTLALQTNNGTNAITIDTAQNVTFAKGPVISGNTLGAGDSSAIKNRIINGSMVISQRNGTSSVTPIDNQYTVDRWKAYVSQTGKLSIQQDAGAVTPPAGFTDYLGVTSLSAYSVTSTDYFAITQSIEGFNMADLGYGSASAKTVTLSFWVRSSLTGTFGGSLTNDAANYTYPFTYTISAANTWEQKAITITGATAGTWLTTNGSGIQVIIALGAGSTRSGTAGAWVAAGFLPSATGATSVVGTNGATWYITGVQLEVGTQATSFEYRQYQQELALCQRYYEKQSTIGSGGSQADFGSGLQNSTTSAYFYAKFNVTKRATPTATFSNILVTDHTTYGTPATLASIGKGYDTVLLYATMSAVGAQYRPALLGVSDNTVAYVDFSAEL